MPCTESCHTPKYALKQWMRTNVLSKLLRYLFFLLYFIFALSDIVDLMLIAYVILWDEALSFSNRNVLVNKQLYVTFNHNDRIVARYSLCQQFQWSMKFSKTPMKITSHLHLSFEFELRGQTELCEIFCWQLRFCILCEEKSVILHSFKVICDFSVDSHSVWDHHKQFMQICSVRVDNFHILKWFQSYDGML